MVHRLRDLQCTRRARVVPMTERQPASKEEQRPEDKEPSKIPPGAIPTSDTTPPLGGGGTHIRGK